ncbi:hypothetical protein [Amycolatopsis sp. CA-128772]|nr:hypothetical protein [Amycolatopsis sp. CA-128772]
MTSPTEPKSRLLRLRVPVLSVATAVLRPMGRALSVRWTATTGR